MPKHKPELIENKVYRAVIADCEKLERKSIGNGHHLAQRISTLVAIEFLSKQEKKIYDCMSTSALPVKQIALASGIQSSTVSAILIHIWNKTCLVSRTPGKGKRFLWSKVDPGL